MTPSRARTGNCLIRGHEVLSHTHAFSDGRHRCLIFLFDPRASHLNLRVFESLGSQPEEAEAEALSQALQFLLLPDSDPETAGTTHSALSIAGRFVDIYCDLVSDNRYQAFPFLLEKDGSRSIIMQFHLREAVTGDTPAVAMNRCIQRLEKYFTAPRLAQV